MRTQTSEHEYNDLAANKGCRQYRTSAALPKAFSEEPAIVCFLHVDNTYARYAPEISRKLLQSKNLVCNATSRTKPHWVSSNFLSINSWHNFSRHLASTFPERLKIATPRYVLHSLLSPFLCEMITPIYQSFAAPPEYQGI